MNTANAIKQGTRPTKHHRWTTMDKAISKFLAYVIKTVTKMLQNNMNNIIKYNLINIIGTL
jgi:hypothetical protein